MILDTVNNAELYFGMHPEFKRAFEFIRSTKEFSKGRHEIDGDKIYANFAEYTTTAADKRKLEAHKKYIDIQYVYEGHEAIEWLSRDCCPSDLHYDEAGDYMLYEHNCPVFTPLEAGMFAIYYPQDFHKPGCSIDGDKTVRKIIVKVRID